MEQLIYKAIVVQKDPMLTNIIDLYSEKTNLIEIQKSFSNAKDAFVYLENNNVDLIFIDNYLLGISGEKIVKYLKTKAKSKAEIIVLSGEASCNIVKNLFNNGIVDYLIIPFSYTRFKSSIQKFIDIKERFNTRFIKQEEIDRLYGYLIEGKGNKNNPDGIKKKTMNVLMAYLNKNINVPLTCEDVSKKVKMSIVTVRHYFRHLVDKGILEYEYDYSTGGRPQAVYVYKK